MKTEKLFEILTLVDSIRSTKWETVMQLVNVIKEKGEKEIVKSKRWEIDRKRNSLEYYPLDLSNIKTWSTYDNTCVEIKFYNKPTTNKSSNKQNQLMCDVKIYDGNSFGGYRKDLRFTATLLLPDSFLYKIQPRIEWALEDYLEDAYEKHLEETKKRWIDKMKKEIVNE